jgi:hypothetical protein
MISSATEEGKILNHCMEKVFSAVNEATYANFKPSKKFGPFSALFWLSVKNSAPKFSGRRQFYSTPFEFCGRNFGPLATLVRAAVRA